MIEAHDTGRFREGEPVVLRYVRNQPADIIMPVTVVRDDEEAIALYVAVGSPLKARARRDGTRLRRDTPFLERERMIGGLADGEWTDHHVLHLVQPGRMSAIWLWWREPEWTFRGYYANLQAPLRRTRLGFDTADYLLDVEIAPDLTCSWKDQEEWDIAWEHRLIDRDVLLAVRAEGERIIADAEARRWPFDSGLETWRPDPAWPVLDMPDGWADGLVFPDQAPPFVGDPPYGM
jgi:hypothetical protein